MPKPTDTRASPQADEADEGRIIQAIWDDIYGVHALGRTVLAVRHAGQQEPLARNIEKLRVLDDDGPPGLSRILEIRLAQPLHPLS